MTQLMTFFSNLNVMSLNKEPLTLSVYCYLTSYRKQHFAVHCNETVSTEVSLSTLIFNPQKYQRFLAYQKKKQPVSVTLPPKYQDYTLQPMLKQKKGNQMVEFINLS